MKSPLRTPWPVSLLNLLAFLATLAAIVVLTLVGEKDTAILTGLVGVLGSFRPWTHSDHSADKPTPPVNREG